MSNERIEAFWRDATAADVARVMNGEKIEARFRDRARDEWKCRGLIGWSRGSESDSFVWASDGLVHYRHCQVYDPPQWYVDKPEPGEGYRLLAKSPDEDLQPGDEAFGVSGKWGQSCLADSSGRQVDCIWYRRRIDHPLLPGRQWLSPGDRLACGDSYYHKGAVQEIDQAYWGNLICIEKTFMRKIEQPKPEPKLAVGQRVQIVGPPIKGEGPIYNWCVEMDKYIGATEFVRSQPQQTFEGVFYQVSNIANWSFREDYLEAVVEPKPEPKPEPKHYKLQVGDTISIPSGHRITVTEHGIEVQ